MLPYDDSSTLSILIDCFLTEGKTGDKVLLAADHMIGVSGWASTSARYIEPMFEGIISGIDTIRFWVDMYRTPWQVGVSLNDTMLEGKARADFLLDLLRPQYKADDLLDLSDFAMNKMLFEQFFFDTPQAMSSGCTSKTS